jgi:hypothetical protein
MPVAILGVVVAHYPGAFLHSLQLSVPETTLHELQQATNGYRHDAADALSLRARLR